MIVDVHESDAVFGSFCPGVWDEPLLDGVPVKLAFYADDERGVIRTYDLGDGKTHGSGEDSEAIREACGLAKDEPMHVTAQRVYYRERRGTVQLRRLSERE